MAISDNYIPLKELGNGSTVQFSANWAVLNAEFLRVFLEDVVTGDQVLQTDGLDYSVEFDKSSFVVTFLVAPTSDNFVVIAREVRLDQIVPYKTSEGFQGVDIENSYDKLTAIDQDQTDAIRRSLKFPLGSTDVGLLPKPISGHGVIWDGDTGKQRNTNEPLGDFEDDLKIVADNIDDIKEIADNLEDIAGITWLGPWLSTTTYEIQDAVEDLGTSYICTRAHLNQQPPDITFWDILAQKGDTGVVDISGSPPEVVTLADEFIFSDVSDGNSNKKDTIQGIVDLFAGQVGADIQEFTSSGTWTKPTSGVLVLVETWAAGGGGGQATAGGGAGGGGGGAYVAAWFDIDDLGATETVTIGAGGAGGSAGPEDGGVGGNTDFGSFITTFGGGGGAESGVVRGGGGGGGGNRSVGDTGSDNDGGDGGDLLGGVGGAFSVDGSDSVVGGGGGGGSGDGVTDSGVGGGSSTGGGGGGGGSRQSTGIGGDGGTSTSGAGGGGGGCGGGGTGGSGGISATGGNGGVGATGATNAANGFVPGGGGGGAETGTGGDGGGGQIRVTTV